MKTIGLIGGLSWESSALYYRWINEFVREKRGGLHSAKILMYSFDFAEIEKLQHRGKWEQVTQRLIDVALRLEKGGADFIVICSNTLHKMAEVIEENTDIPLLHIADATAEAVKSRNIRSVGLLGTKFTMEQHFYRDRLAQKHGLEIIIPDPDERQKVHEIIYGELCLGQCKPSSKKEYLRIIDRLVDKGAEGVLLACTEITLLVRQEDTSVPLFDTAYIHAHSAVKYALGESG